MLRILIIYAGISFGCLSIYTPAVANEALAEKIKLCGSCHAENGVPEDPQVPVIWGQHYYYIYVQLRDFKAGRRKNETMEETVSELTKDDMKALAQHFSEKTWPRLEIEVNEKNVAIGQTAAIAGQCPQCHLGGYEGNSRIPYMRGQSTAYLEKTMLEFKNRIRLNSPSKSSLMHSYSDEQIKGMAEFISGL